MTRFLILAAFAALGCRAVPDSRAPAVPQRPTLSSYTSTAAEGTFELEEGFTWDPSDLFDTPILLRYGASERTELFLGGSPLRVVDVPRGTEAGVGDLVVGARHRFADETARNPSFAVQGSLKLPTADEDDGLGTGELDVGFAGIATRNLGDLSLTGFYQLDVLGDPAGGTQVGHQLAAAVGQPLLRRISTFGELAGVLVPESDFESVFTTLGATYAHTPSLVLDAAVAIGLSQDAPDVVFLVGLTRNLGRLEAEPLLLGY